MVAVMLPNPSEQLAAGITGTLPSTIANLTQLQLLNMDGNRLTGSIPDSMALLQQMTVLALGRNSLVHVYNFLEWQSLVRMDMA